MNRKKIKEEAKKLIKGNLWHILVPFLITSVISGVVSSALTSSNPESASTLLLALAIEVLIYPMSYGATVYLVKFVRGEEHDLNLLFKFYNKFIFIFAINFLIGLFTTLWTLLLIIPGIIAALKYSMAILIMIDGEEDPMQCILKSKAMMKGYKWDYFKFLLSFFWWCLLIVPTLGLILIYLEPYMLTSQVLYYEELKKIS